MTVKTRWVVVYRSDDPTKTGTVSFGIKATTKAKALTRTREFIYANELHDNPTQFDYKLNAEASQKPALYEISDNEGVEHSEENVVYEDF